MLGGTGCGIHREQFQAHLCFELLNMGTQFNLSLSETIGTVLPILLHEDICFIYLLDKQTTSCVPVMYLY